MRVSIRPNDSGYRNWVQLASMGKRIIVKLDGEQQTLCITADDEAGVIVRHVKDNDGNLIFDKDRQAFEDEVRHGRVEIEVSDAMVL